jgi:hypothetical protein
MSHKFALHGTFPHVLRSSWALPVAYTRHVRNAYKVLVTLEERDHLEAYDIYQGIIHKQNIWLKDSKIHALTVTLASTASVFPGEDFCNHTRAIVPAGNVLRKAGTRSHLCLVTYDGVTGQRSISRTTTIWSSCHPFLHHPLFSSFSLHGTAFCPVPNLNL